MCVYIYIHVMGRPVGHLIVPLMTLIGDPIYEHFLTGFRGQPRHRY